MQWTPRRHRSDPHQLRDRRASTRSQPHRRHSPLHDVHGRQTSQGIRRPRRPEGEERPAPTRLDPAPLTRATEGEHQSLPAVRAANEHPGHVQNRRDDHTLLPHLHRDLRRVLLLLPEQWTPRRMLPAPRCLRQAHHPARQALRRPDEPRQ